MRTILTKKRQIIIGLIIYVLVCLGIWVYKYELSYIKDIVPATLDYKISSIEEFDQEEGWDYTDESSIRMHSKNNDPKIFIKVPDIEKIYIDIFVNEIGRNNSPIKTASAEIFYTSDTNFTSLQRVTFDIRRGHNIVQVPIDQSYNYLRVDLTDKSDVNIDIKYFNITNYFKIEWFFKYFLLAFLFTIVVIILLFPSRLKNKLESIIAHFFKPIVDFEKQFLKYLNENRKGIIVTFLFVLLSYGLLCAYYTIYVDEERQIIETYADTGWIAQGRWGNYLFERFFLTGTVYTSWLGDVLACILLGISTLVNIFNYTKLSNKQFKTYTKIIYCGICISVPYVYGAYMVVGIYNIEISLGLLLVALATYFALVSNEKTSVRLLYSCVILTLGISIYQAFVPVFITNVVLGLLIKTCFSRDKISFKYYIISIFESILICGLSILFYYLINIIYSFSVGYTSSYLTNSFVGWGKGKPAWSIILEIIENIKLVVTGSSKILYGGIIYQISFWFLGMWGLFQLFSPRKNKIMLLFLVLCGLLAPFSLNFVLGNTRFAGRTLLGLPNLLGIIWIILIEEFESRKIICSIMQVVAAYLVFLQLQYINQFFLADFKRYQEDQIITQQIISDIRDACGGYTQMPIVPVGTYWHDDNDLTMSYELAGSYYTVDGGSITRIIRFIQAQGYNVDMPTAEQIADSYGHINDMPYWPVKGSVKNINGYVIVKLSEPSDNWIKSYVQSYQPLNN